MQRTVKCLLTRCSTAADNPSPGVFGLVDDITIHGQKHLILCEQEILARSDGTAKAAGGER